MNVRSAVRVCLVLVLCACSCVAYAQAPQIEVAGNTLTVGPKPTTPLGSSVRLDGLATTGGTEVLMVNNAGDVSKEALSAYTRRDIAESISGYWSFTNGLATTGVSLYGDLTFNGNARRIRGNFDAASERDRPSFQSLGTGNGMTIVQAIPSGAAQVSGFAAYNSADPANASVLLSYVTNAGARIVSNAEGTGTVLPIGMQVGGGNTALELAPTGHLTHLLGGVPRMIVNPSESLKLASPSQHQFIDYYAGTATSGSRNWRQGIIYSGAWKLEALDDNYTSASTLLTGFSNAGIANALRVGPAVNAVSPETSLFTAL